MAFSLKFQKKSPPLEQFILTLGQNNFGKKIPFLQEKKMLLILPSMHIAYHFGNEVKKGSSKIPQSSIGLGAVVGIK